MPTKSIFRRLMTRALRAPTAAPIRNRVRRLGQTFEALEDRLTPAINVAVVYQTLDPAITDTVAQLNDSTAYQFNAAAVHYSSVSTLAALSAYDVVVQGGYYADTLSPAYWS